MSEKQMFQFKVNFGNEDFRNYCRKNNEIFLGWQETGDLSSLTKDEIKKKLKEHYPKYLGNNPHKIGNALGQVNTFAHVMQEGDFVLIYIEEHVHIGVVKKYEYRLLSGFTTPSFQNHKTHVRSVEWKHQAKITNFPSEIQRFILSRNTISKFPRNVSEFEVAELFGDVSSADSFQLLASPSFSGENLIKNNHREREMMDLLLSELYREAVETLGDLLKSEVEEIRLKAALEIIHLK
jgi:predicted Mrr-cat superfamily restriction endonuclease